MSDLYWHFLREERHMRYPPYLPVVAGETYRVTGPLVLCQNGLHASLRALDALEYAPGSIVCRVLLGDEVIHDGDKVCARERTVLWMADAAPVLHEFACLVAEQVLALAAAHGYPSDPRSTAAITAKRAWLRGELSDPSLDRTRDEAWATVWALVRRPEWDEAWAAARAAAWSAARDAVKVATRTFSATFAASFAGDAGRLAVRQTADETLERMLAALAAGQVRQWYHTVGEIRLRHDAAGTKGAT